MKKKRVKKKEVFNLGNTEDRRERLWLLHELAFSRKIPGLENVGDDPFLWIIDSGKLLSQSGKNVKTATISFRYPEQLGRMALTSSWKMVCQALLRLRFYRGNQSLSNLRNFVTAVIYIDHAAFSLGQKFISLTPEALELACLNISAHYADTTAYNLHKAVAEFSGYCDANRLCNCYFDFRYSRLRRPKKSDAIGHIRLDDVETTKTISTKVLNTTVYQVIGELYRKVPRDHVHRTYILILTLLCCLGRRYSEIVTLPNHEVYVDENKNYYIDYFPRKQSAGDTFTPHRKLCLPTQVVQVVRDVFSELKKSCARARDTAAESLRTGDIDMRFLDEVKSDQKLFSSDLKKLGVSPGILLSTHWFYKEGHVFSDGEKKPKYTTKEKLLNYCRKYFLSNNLEFIHIDQSHKKYYLKDLLIVRFVGLSSGAYSCWSASMVSHSMMTTFLRNFPKLVSEYSSIHADFDFTSHQFRHTLNTLLDEGGLSDLMQSEWFGRRNHHDTKAYQHTSREKRALMLRQDIRDGKVGGKLPELLEYVPVDVRDAFLAARIGAVHDVGPGMCVHNFIQLPCERHLQCSADCDEYVWRKDDIGRVGEVKRQYALTYLTRAKADELSRGAKGKKSIDWIVHSDKKLNTLRQQLLDNGITDFDPDKYLHENEHD